jgi:hypothetical protein
MTTAKQEQVKVEEIITRQIKVSDKWIFIWREVKK